MLGNLTENGGKLKRIFIEPKLPAGLSPLHELATNLWWSWNHEAIELFHSIDPELFVDVNYNPLALLDELSMEKAQALLDDGTFTRKLKSVHSAFKKYIDEPKDDSQGQIAYFCMEYGLHQSLRLYSGGLGVLAGDYLKEISDRNVNVVAVGLLYRYGYFQQSISLHGEQIHQLEAAKFTQLPILPVRDAQGTWIKVYVNLSGRTVWAKVWELRVGRMSLYLLDTDIDDNNWEDRSLTHQLYGGDNEHRLRQEVLLGIGGVRALKAMKMEPDLYHLNEGHAAFLGLERLANYLRDKHMPFDQALEIVRATQLFTTHTPVPAGHDSFPESLLRDYLFEFTNTLGISWEQLVALGRVHPGDSNELFSMSHLAIRTSLEVNGVSRLHGEVSQKMFNDLYPEYNYAELYVGYVTNGVHFPTWVASEWLELYQETFGKGFLNDQTNRKFWSKIQDVPAQRIMDLRQRLKKRLLDWVRQQLQIDLTRRGENPRTIFEIIKAIREDALVIGFARRFATYKRATLLFSNEKRLADILNNTDRPVIFLFAGKAHPADKGGQEYIQFIYNTTTNPDFKGKVIFLENYGMEMAKLLTQGVDIWLNNPTRPKEASGTSGMKAVMNGVMNFSVLDGWWCEGYKPGAGWALPEEETYPDPALQNELDAETIYNILESDIIPSFYERDAEGVSERWVSHIKNTIADIAPDFVMSRMLNDYQERFYSKLWTRSRQLKKNNFKALQDLVAWKSKVRAAWDHIEVTALQAPDTFNHALPLGEQFEATVSLNLHALKAADIGVEVVFFRRISETQMEFISRHELEALPQNGGSTTATYHCAITLQTAGVFEFGFRMFPKHPMLAHRQDFNLVKWL
ncbi:MAG: alpha-glucan family phosphorylase [Saprospiraceae bacterium]|nr:alpha-glucan family phosphorylase [Saprospiraceae bacterium]